MTNEELIDGLNRKDDRAYEVVIRLHQEKVYRTCMGFVQNREDAEDLTQEVFIEVFRSIAGFRAEAKLSTWIHRIAVNKSLNFLRKSKSRPWLENFENLFFPEEGRQRDFMGQGKDRPDELIENRELERIIKKAMNKLPDNQRIAFILHQYEDLPYKEIAQIMEVSLSAVESLIFRAKYGLQKHLVSYYKKHK